MRDLRLIGWSKEEQTWLPVSEYNQSYNFTNGQYLPMMLTIRLANNEYVMYDVDSGFPVRQYTGLKDKNGVEIYEGDLLDHLDKVYVVKWDEYMAAFQTENIKDKVDADFFNWGNMASLETKDVPRNWNNGDGGNCEVIGNIYENPELLK